MSRVAVVANPTSGGGRGLKAAAATIAQLRSEGHQVTDVSAASAVAALHQARAAVASGVDALVVVGGDGMAHLGVNACSGTGVPLGLVPAGSGNDTARGLGIPVGDAARAARAASRVLAGGGGRLLDAGRTINTGGDVRWFLGVLSAGFDALVNERANGWSWPRGRLKYNLAIARELPPFRPMRYDLVLDGQASRIEAMLVAVANGTSFGGGMRIAPDARPDDGLLDVVVLGPLPKWEFVRVFPSVFSGAHVRHRAVSVQQVRCVSVSTPDVPVVGYADGERVWPLPLRCEVVPGAVRVLA